MAEPGTELGHLVSDPGLLIWYLLRTVLDGANSQVLHDLREITEGKNG